MAAAIKLRTDYTSVDLRRFSRRCEDADQVRRLLALAHILDGGSRSEAAKISGVTLQIVRDWVLRFNEGGPEGLATRKAPGRASILNDEQRARLAEQVEAGPIPAAHGVVCSATFWMRTRIASPDLLPKTLLLPHLECSPGSSGASNEEDKYVDACGVVGGSRGAISLR